MDGVALQAERRWAWRNSQAWCCSSCLTAPLEDRAELELMELSLSLPSLMSYFCSELAVCWQSSGQHSSLANFILCVGNGNHIWKGAQELWSGCSWHKLPQNEKGALFTEIIQMRYLCTLGKYLIFSQQSLQLLRALQIKAFKGWESLTFVLWSCSPHPRKVLCGRCCVLWISLNLVKVITYMWIPVSW